MHCANGGFVFAFFDHWNKVTRHILQHSETKHFETFGGSFADRFAANVDRCSAFRDQRFQWLQQIELVKTDASVPM